MVKIEETLIDKVSTEGTVEIRLDDYLQYEGIGKCPSNQLYKELEIVCKEPPNVIKGSKAKSNY